MTLIWFKVPASVLRDIFCIGKQQRSKVWALRNTKLKNRRIIAKNALYKKKSCYSYPSPLLSFTPRHKIRLNHFTVNFVCLSFPNEIIWIPTLLSAKTAICATTKQWTHLLQIHIYIYTQQPSFSYRWKEKKPI